MLDKNKSCADYGMENCPCMLSACGECLICSRLAGKDYCDCDWQGVCIYSEFVQNGRLPERMRESRLYKILRKIWYENDLVVMRIEVPAGLAESASLPGSYVFARAEADPDCFDMPVSVMRTDYENSILELAVKAAGPKSVNLINSDEYIWMRGIYRNGLLGADKLTAPGCRNVLCITKGTGLAPAVNYCRWAQSASKIDMMIDLDKINRFFAEDCLTGCLINRMRYHRLSLDDAAMSYEKYDAVMVCASDYYQQNLNIPREKLVITNNHTLCCGEGICGACVCTDADGKMSRMCKCRTE